MQKYALGGDAAVGAEARAVLRDPHAPVLSPTHAVECVQLLAARVEADKDELAGELAAELLRASPAARSHVAARLGTQPAAVLALFERFGADAGDALVTVLLDAAAWGRDADAARPRRECFRWFLARVRAEPGAVRAVARLLASHAEELHSCMNQTGLEQLLGLLDAGVAADTRSHATLAVARFVDAAGTVGESMIAKFMAAKLAAECDDDLRLAFSVAAAIFPLVPQFAAQLFLTDGFVEALVPSLQGTDVGVEVAALEMLSAACVDKACRTAIATHCTEYLEALVAGGEADKSAAAVVLAKVKYTPGEGKDVQQQDVDKLAGVFKAMMLKDDAESRDSSVEGLAYTSLKGSVKEMLIKDKTFVKSLVETLKNSAGKPTVMFGALTVVSNLTVYAPTLSEEQRKVAQLKNYAETKPNAKVEPDKEDRDERVTPRCKALIDAGVVPALVACSKKVTPNALASIANIVLSLSKQQKHRGTIASQGGVKLSLQLYSSASGESAQDRTVRQTAAHALGRILVSVNPSHVFSSQLAISSAIRPLFSLLEEAEELKDQLPVFEALLSLTNLASTEDGIRDQIIRLAWTKIEELLLSDNVMIQRATVELVCNLMGSPTAVAKFADGSKAASNRLHILLALADAEDFATRRAAGGALAMLTEWDKACEAVVAREHGVRIVLAMVAEDNEEIRHRGVVVVRNLVCGTGAYVDKVREEGGVDVLRSALKSTHQPVILEVGVEALRVLMAAGGQTAA